MKKILISTIAVSLLATANLFGDATAEIAEYDRYFNEINEIRVGIPNRDIDKLDNPFISLLTAPANTGNASAPTFKLSAIVEKKVKINDSWLTQGSTINGMRVVAIKQRSVVLGSENRVVELFLREKNENSIITTN